MEKPIYQMLMDDIIEEIETKPPNTPILSERELAEKHSVSRMTARRAITELVKMGYLYTNKNKGTFVADKKMHKTSMQSLTELSFEHNDYKILYFDVRNSNVCVIKQLEMNAFDYYTRIVRLNFKDNKPFSVDEIYINAKYLASEHIDAMSFLKQFTKDIDNLVGTQTFIPMILPVPYANLLELPVDTPIIKVESTYRSNKGKPYVFVSTYNHPKLVEIKITL